MVKTLENQIAVSFVMNSYPFWAIGSALPSSAFATFILLDFSKGFLGSHIFHKESKIA